jgi:hypothetical protein
MICLDVVENLLNCCDHHPLTVSIIENDLRKETKEKKWENASSDLQTYIVYSLVSMPYLDLKK